MNVRLVSEFRRLYLQADAPQPVMGARLGLLGPDGGVRCMVLSLGRPADWPALSAVWRGVQIDFELPAPAIAVNGVDAYELWFSLAVPVPLDQAHAFLMGLRRRYLADVKAHRLELRPSADGATAASTTPMIPATPADSGLWSAFVAPDLAAVFGEEPALDLPPGLEAQADLLSRLKPMSLPAFEAALSQLLPEEPDGGTPVAPVVTAQVTAQGLSAPRSMVFDPEEPVDVLREDARRFLQAVMNDAAVPMALRIEAAKALLTC